MRTNLKELAKLTSEELNEKAWEYLDEKGLKLSEKIMIRHGFSAPYKEEHPFIDTQYEKGKIKYYHSKHEAIKSYLFTKKEEVILANAIYENLKEVNINDFRSILKYTFRILGIQNKWT